MATVLPEGIIGLQSFVKAITSVQGSLLDIKTQCCMIVQDLVGDIHCIIEATIGRSSEVMLEKPNTEGVPDHVLGDPDRLRGILLNLYTNAAKFTKRGSIALRVRVASKDYRPCPEQVIKQQQRGPYARHSSSHHHGNVPHNSNPARQHNGEHVSWGSISVSPKTRSSFANYEQPRSSDFNQVPAEATAAAAATGNDSPNQPSAEAANTALQSLRRAYDAKDASDAINQAHDIVTPVANEHIAGQGMLQRTAQVINKASNRLQADAGAEPQGSAKPHRGCKLQTADLLEPVKEDAADSQLSDHLEAELDMSQSSGVDSQDADFSAQQSGSLQKQAVGQQEAGIFMKHGSSSGRVSSNSVLDHQDESSSSGGGSPPSDLQVMAQSIEQQQQPSIGQQGSADAAAEALHTLQTRPVLCQGGRQGGTPRTIFGERTHSNSDIADSDTSYRKSSGSFSDHPPPLRKSFSSPAVALHEAAEGAIAGQQSSTSAPQSCPLGSSMATSFNGRSNGRSTKGKGEATAVQDLGGGWFDTVAHRKAPVLVETMRSQQAHQPQGLQAVAEDSSSSKLSSAFQIPPSPAGTAASALQELHEQES